MMEKKLGELFCYPVFVDDSKKFEIEITFLIERLKARFFIIPQNVCETPQKMKSLITSIRKKSSETLYFGVYAGGGAQLPFSKNVTLIPSNMTTGFSGKAKNSTVMAGVLASELKAIGIDFVISDFLNINLHSYNPLVGPNAFGDQPDGIKEYIENYIKAFKKEGILLIGRHFPGIGGLNEFLDDKINTSHRTLTEMFEEEIVNFRNAIEYGIHGIELSSVYYFKESKKVAESAVFSPDIVDFLTNTLKYSELIVSAPLFEKKFKDYNPVNTPRKAFDAGCNFIIMPHGLSNSTKSWDDFLLSIKKGEIEEEKIEKINNVHFFEENLKQGSKKSLFYQKKDNSKHIYKILLESIKIFHGKKVWDNFKNLSDIMVVAPETMMFDIEAKNNYFFKSVRNYKRTAEFFEYGIEPENDFINRVKQKASKKEGVIYFSYSSHLSNSRENLGIALSRVNENTVIVGIDSPYEYGIFTDSPCYACIASYYENAIQAVSEKLFKGSDPYN